MQFDADKTAFIKGLYYDILGRAPDAEGLRFWEEYPDSNLVEAFKAEAQRNWTHAKILLRVCTKRC
jgi:hypothetical protein